MHNFLTICLNSLRKTVEKVSPFLVTLTSRSDSDVESSNVTVKENKPDGVNPNSNNIDYYVQKMKEKFYGFRQTVNKSDNKIRTSGSFSILFSVIESLEIAL